MKRKEKKETQSEKGINIGLVLVDSPFAHSNLQMWNFHSSNFNFESFSLSMGLYLFLVMMNLK